MYFKSKKISLFILGVTALGISRVLFTFINDPEGPNLLIVVGMAVILYFGSLATFLFKPSTTGFKTLLLVILVQLVLAAGFYFCLN